MAHFPIAPKLFVNEVALRMPCQFSDNDANKVSAKERDAKASFLLLGVAKNIKYPNNLSFWFT